MHEIEITRNNPMIDPTLHIWGYDVALYLFLGGFAAGLMIISGFFIYMGRQSKPKCSCFLMPLISIISISLGMFFLFLDLENKLQVFRFYTTFEITSPMSWGSWILIIVYPVLIANALIRLPDPLQGKLGAVCKISDKIRSHPFVVKLFGILSMITGALLGAYTGILLSTMSARPLWNSSMLWSLFLVSGLSTAAAFIHLVARRADERRMLARADNGFLIAELIIIGLIFIGFLSSPQASQDAVNLLLSGSYAAVFWIFVVLMGIVLPLIIQILAVSDKIQHTPIAPIMVILGGLILRFVIVYAGQESSWATSTLSGFGF